MGAKRDRLHTRDRLSRLIWNCQAIPNSIRLNQTLHFNEWLNDLTVKVDAGLCDLSIVLHICWQIWKERNQVVFHNKVPNHSWIVKFALNLGKEFIEANSISPVSKSGSNPSLRSSIRWRPPDAGFVKLNFDGSMVNQGAASGFVIRNLTGEPIAAGTRFTGQNTIFVAECLALHNGLWLAKAK
ncbi:uncharacterized protein LOC126619680 [Malus sylvestris]|uniref:uncharacterized protein LOC126619680 n=1 Tax=Malus sylvestris TaxID=3752 RepID=UPI0021ACEB94|nr:uncharacterized protein LOC126619680 [Malus sylvestris]